MPEINVDTILDFIIGLLNKVLEAIGSDFVINFKKPEAAE